MPGGGTPALAPMKAPDFVEASMASNAFAGERAKAAKPVAARRALILDFMSSPITCSKTGAFGYPLGFLTPRVQTGLIAPTTCVLPLQGLLVTSGRKNLRFYDECFFMTIVMCPVARWYRVPARPVARPSAFENLSRKTDDSAKENPPPDNVGRGIFSE